MENKTKLVLLFLAICLIATAVVARFEEGYELEHDDDDAEYGEQVNPDEDQDPSEEQPMTEHGESTLEDSGQEAQVQSADSLQESPKKTTSTSTTASEPAASAKTDSITSTGLILGLAGTAVAAIIFVGIIGVIIIAVIIRRKQQFQPYDYHTMDDKPSFPSAVPLGHPHHIRVK